MAQIKELHTKLVATEQRVEELQKKSDEYRRGCVKYQADREKLRAELEKIKQSGPDGQPESQQIQTDAGATANIGKPSSTDWQQKYESLRTRHHVSPLQRFLCPSYLRSLFL